MNFIDNIYATGPMAPVCQINQHLAIYQDQAWKGFQVDFIEPIPRSSAFIVDLVVLQATGPLAAGAQIAQQLSQVIQQNKDEMCHFRFFALDDIEAQLWQLASQARFTSRGGQAGVNLFTPQFDPYLATTTFFVLGGQGDRDAQIGCTNVSGGQLPTARVGFFGFRYLLKEEKPVHDRATYIPAQGR